MHENRKVLVIGLDGVPPELLFDDTEILSRMPNVNRLMDEGIFGPMKSTDPPITVPAWTTMTTGMDPGELGLYGFRNRCSYQSRKLFVADSSAVKAKRLWQLASRAGLRSIIHGIPQTWPPSPLRGIMISSFLTPDAESGYTWPHEIKEEINSLNRENGGYISDIRDFRHIPVKTMAMELDRVAEIFFRTTAFLLEKYPWNLSFNVLMTSDRLHHTFWKYWDAQHRDYVKNNRWEHVIPEYYAFIDRNIGYILSRIDIERTAVLLVSDHGARALDGVFGINEWLRQNGYLKLDKAVEMQVEKEGKTVEFAEELVDWSGSVAWGEGGYYGRIFLNVKGRDKGGVLDWCDYDSTKRKIREELENFRDHTGQQLGNICVEPADIYQEVLGIPPDLMLYPGNLSLRCTASVGVPILGAVNDTGPDGANHSHHGIMILRPAGGVAGVKARGLNIMDVAPTILSLLGLEVPEYMRGQNLTSV